MTGVSASPPATRAAGVGEIEEDLTGGGRLSVVGRRAAIAAALPLLATYFADAPTWNLETQAQISTATVETRTDDEQQVDDLAAALRLRAGLAAAERLLGILRRITARPTFRYTQISTESVGAVRGRLDLARYSRSRGRLDVPRRYPVRQVTREEATPENVLAAYAAQWIDRDLGSIPPDLLPRAAPERRQLDRIRLALRSALSRPGFAGASEQAHRVWRRGGATALLSRVDTRLRGGHVSPLQPYQELADWVRSTLDRRPLADPGEVEWAFYDARFDTKLFEIWCLQEISRALSDLLGPPTTEPPILARRGSGPLYSWHTGAGVLHLHFQPHLATLPSANVVWHFQPGDRPLAGYPDLAFTASRVDGSAGLALLDPKLRQRRGAPTEEIYKLLGYFAHLNLGPRALGAIIYYGPGAAQRYQLTSPDGGVVEAVAVDPASEEVSQASIAHLADLALRTAGFNPGLGRKLASHTNPTGDEEGTAAVRQALAVEAMATAAASLTPGSLAPTRKSTAASLHDVWPLLSEQTQTMLVTAEYFGNRAPDGADHSGPLLGLAATVERVLYECLLEPAAQECPGHIDPHLTLGRALRLLDDALRGRNTSDARTLASHITRRPDIDHRTLAAIIEPAKQMNVRFRIPAAHRDVIDATTWVAGRAAILDRPDGLLLRLTITLGTDHSLRQ